MELKVYNSRWKSIRLMLICSPFVVIGFLMLGQPDAPQWAAWFSILFFGLGYPLGIYQLFNRKPQLTLNEIGIFAPAIHHDFINWEIIRDAYVAEVYRQQFICLVLDEQFEPSKRKGKLRQHLADLNKELGFQELNIPLTSLAVDAVKLATFILVVQAAAMPEREFLFKQARLT
jgi:hypothetical protein